MGYALIINNMKFASDQFRWGSDKDAAGLKTVFSNLGLQVSVEQDLDSKVHFPLFFCCSRTGRLVMDMKFWISLCCFDLSSQRPWKKPWRNLPRMKSTTVLAVLWLQFWATAGMALFSVGTELKRRNGFDQKTWMELKVIIHTGVRVRANVSVLFYLFRSKQTKRIRKGGGGIFRRKFGFHC